MLVVAGRVAFLIQWRVADVTIWRLEYIVHYLENLDFSILGNKKVEREVIVNVFLVFSCARKNNTRGILFESVLEARVSVLLLCTNFPSNPQYLLESV